MEKLLLSLQLLLYRYDTCCVEVACPIFPYNSRTCLLLFSAPMYIPSPTQDVFRRLTSPTLKKLYRFVLKRLVGRFLDNDIALEVLPCV